MMRRGPSDVYLSFSLDKEKADSLTRQLAEQVREAIVSGALAPLDRLPSTRTIAEHLDVSRTTAEAAYAVLIADGYIEGFPGSGTRVVECVPGAPTLPTKTWDAVVGPDVLRGAATDRDWQSAFAEMLAPQRSIPFAMTAPAPELGPGAAWTRIAKRVADTSWQHGRDVGANGHEPLRQAICEYVGRTRGVRCDPDQIIVTAGIQQGLALCVRVLLTERDRAWYEEPSYPAIPALLRDRGVSAIPVPVDRDGVVVAAAAIIAGDAKAAFVTPSNQFPLGRVLSEARRTELLQWAIAGRRWIVEDDYDGEVRYTGRPLPAIQSSAPSHVIHLGSFGKILPLGLRIGYMVVPPRLAEAFIAARSLVDRQSPIFEQRVLAEYMKAGHLQNHIRRIRLIYAERRNALHDACNRHLQSFGSIVERDQGTHIVFRLDERIDDRAACRSAREHGIEARPLSAYYSKPQSEKGLVLGFGGFLPYSIDAAAMKLAECLRKGR